jgi:hypothetical protein
MVILNALGKSCAKIACCSSDFIFTFLCVGSNIQNACEQIVSCIRLSFVNFPLHPAQKNKHRSGRKEESESDSELDTCSNKLFFTMTDKFASQNTALSFLITLHRWMDGWMDEWLDEWMDGWVDR